MSDTPERSTEPERTEPTGLPAAAEPGPDQSTPAGSGRVDANDAAGQGHDGAEEADLTVVASRARGRRSLEVPVLSPADDDAVPPAAAALTDEARERRTGTDPVQEPVAGASDLAATAVIEPEATRPDLAATQVLPPAPLRARSAAPTWDQPEAQPVTPDATAEEPAPDRAPAPAPPTRPTAVVPHPPLSAPAATAGAHAAPAPRPTSSGTPMPAGAFGHAPGIATAADTAAAAAPQGWATAQHPGGAGPWPTQPSQAGGQQRRPAQRSGWWQGLIAGALAGALIGGGTAWAVTSSTRATVTGGGPGVVIQNPQAATSVTAAAAKALPSVVTISVTRGSTGGSGSGIVLDQEGHILTNQHVATLAGATSRGTIDVMTSDGRVLPAKLVGQDPLYDLAVLKVDGTGLTPIEWADLSKINVGDVAVAVGAPLGLPNSVSDGVVSNLDRSIPVTSSAVDENEGTGDGDGRFSLPDQDGGSSQAKGQVSLNVIQTDAAINHGNSGGALVNAAGQLIGVNVAIYSPTEEGGSIGIGFAVRGDIAQRVANEMIATGKASHGKLGVSIASAEVTDAGNSTGFTRGATVADVPADSAAAAAGMQRGDVIVKVGDKPTYDATDVTATVRSYAAGTEVQITVQRGNARETLRVKLGEASS